MGNQEGGGSWEGEYLQRRSMTRRPSDKRPVDLWKKERPLGGLMGKPSPEASPPVSELESPNTNRIPLPGLSHPPTLVVLTATAIEEEEEDNIHRNSINSSEDATLGDSPPQPIVLILNDTSVCVCCRLMRVEACQQNNNLSTLCSRTCTVYFTPPPLASATSLYFIRVSYVSICNFYSELINFQTIIDS